MKGLRTQESEKFNRFWNIVQEKAEKQGMIFFADHGEGNDFETDEMEGEDFCGWLIPFEKEKEFEKDWKDSKVSDDWTDNIVWLEWSEENGNIKIDFNNYD